MPKTWVKIHIEFLDNPKVMTLSLSLRGVWFTALGIAERYDRDGLLPPADRFALMAHTDDETAEKAFAALAKKGLLDETSEGFRVHDWQDWQARKPSDEPEAVAARQAKWYANKKTKDITLPNALGDVEQKPNAPNAYARAPSEIKSERKKREENPPASLRSASPKGGRIPATWPAVDCLQAMVAYGVSLGLTQNQTEEHIAEYHDFWEQSTLRTATSLDWVKRWRLKIKEDIRIGRIGGSPPTRAPTNGHRPQTFGEIKLDNTMAAIAEFERISNEQESLQHTDGTNGYRLRRGDEHPAHARVLGSGEKPQR